jgi:hypothetical protein
MQQRTHKRLSTNALAAAVLSAVVALLAGAYPVTAQDSDGRAPGGTTTRAKPRPKRPKKKIDAVPPSTTAKVPTSSVIIRSQPAGAEVFVDGKLVGTTADDGELELGELRLGPHLIVLRKEGFREWSQTVTLRTPEPIEVNPLLQDLNAQMPRDVSKIPAIDFGKPFTGQLTRDDQVARDGSGFYDELLMRVGGVEAFLIKCTAAGFEPSLRILDDDNRTFDVRPIAEGIYQTVSVPHAGTYYLRISAQIDESSFEGGDYTVSVQPESAARTAQVITVGQTVDGQLESTDRTSRPGDYYDAWTFEGQEGARVRITASSESFTPGLTLLLNNSAVATTGGKGSKKKASSGGPNIEQTLTSGTYTIYVRSADGAKLGAYQLTIASAEAN